MGKCGINSEDSIEDLETGLIHYLRNVITDLRKISRQNQTNEESIKRRFCSVLEKEAEEKRNNATFVTIQDPLGDYRFAEKRELELEKFYENKI